MTGLGVVGHAVVGSRVVHHRVLGARSVRGLEKLADGKPRRVHALPVLANDRKEWEPGVMTRWIGPDLKGSHDVYG